MMRALHMLLVLFVLLHVASPRKAVRTKTSRKARRQLSSLVQAAAVSEHGLDTQDFSFEEVLPLAADSVDVEMHACSLGSADAQQLRGEWGACLLPMIPGREAVGVITAVGSAVKGLQVGHRVAVLLGSGVDAENDKDGADRSTLDFVTTGAAAHQIRVPSRWVFPLPVTLPSAQTAGMLTCGGSIWCHLTQRRLARDCKIGVLGDGPARDLAVAMAAALGFDTYTLSLGSSSLEEHDKSLRGSQGHLAVDIEENLRLHGGSFDAVLCVTSREPLGMTPVLPFLKRGGDVLLANTQVDSLSLSPRLLQERRLQLVGGGTLSQREMLAMLAFCAQRRIRLKQSSSEFSAENVAEALRGIAVAPESRAVLVRSSAHSRWIRANRSAPVQTTSGSVAAGAAGSLSSMLGVFSKVADEGKKAASAMREGISKQANKLVEQVEREQQEEMEAKFGRLSLQSSTLVEKAASSSNIEEGTGEDDDDDAGDDDVDDDDDDDDAVEDNEDEEEDEDDENDEESEDDDTAEDDEGDDEVSDGEEEDDDDDEEDEEDEEDEDDDEADDDEEADDEDEEED